MVDDTTGFDSRFDPAFQRGFDGSVAEVRPLAVPPPTPAPVDFDRFAATVAAASTTQPAAASETATERASATEADDDAELDDDESRGLNPFVLALAALSVVLIGGGIYAAQSVSASYADDAVMSSLDYVTFSLIIYSVPLAVALGVATAIGVLFMLAARWNRGGATRSGWFSRKNGA